MPDNFGGDPSLLNSPERRSASPPIADEGQGERTERVADEENVERQVGAGEGDRQNPPLSEEHPESRPEEQRRALRPLKRKTVPTIFSTPSPPKRPSTASQSRPRSVVFGVPSLTGSNAIPIASPPSTAIPRSGPRSSVQPSLANRISSPQRPVFQPLISSSQSSQKAPSLSTRISVPQPRPRQLKPQPKPVSTEESLPDLVQQLDSALSIFSDHTSRLVEVYQKFNNSLGSSSSSPASTQRPVHPSRRLLPPANLADRIGDRVADPPAAGPSSEQVPRNPGHRGRRGGKKRNKNKGKESAAKQ